jgi:rhodanese-related sulfurtransferase
VYGRPGMAEAIDHRRLRELLDGGAQLVDVLPPEEHEEEHLPGALSIPLKQLDAKSAAQLERGEPLVVYCWDYL